MFIRYETWPRSTLNVSAGIHRLNTRLTLRIGRAGLSLFIPRRTASPAQVVAIAALLALDTFLALALLKGA